MPAGAEFRVLGPLRVIVAGRPIEIQANKHRVVLAALLLCPNSEVTTDRLVGHLWHAEPPGDCGKSTLQTYVMRLRRAMAGVDVVRTTPTGYAVDVDATTLDLVRFRRGVARGKVALEVGDLAAAGLEFSQALQEWSGDPLSNVDSESLWREEIPRLIEERLEAQEQRADVGLRLGEHHRLVSELSALAREHPLREKFSDQLMLALYRSGRQADALAAFHRVRATLSEELGLRPGPDLVALHQAILENDPALDLPERGAVRLSPAAVPVPRQLPAAPAFLAGRADELGRLDAALRSHEDSHSGPTVVALDGTAGVGKSALAITWAHRVADRFLDGQLFVNLRGYGPGPPVRPAAALEALLHGLGVPGGAIPAGLDERAALWRTHLAGRRMLVVLDNAAGGEQVRPLLPASDSLVLVTSRSQLRGLAARDGARRISVNELSRPDAVALLEATLGADRVAAESEATAELTDLCARLPLALRVVGERAARLPSLPLAELADVLRDERGRLAELDLIDDAEVTLESALSWSYQALDPGAARMFRLLGLHPGPEIGPAAAAALAGVTRAAAAGLLDRLAACHLIEERRLNRYEFHDLLRSYAGQQAEQSDAESERVAAVRRVVEFYARSAASARLTMVLNVPRIRREPPLDAPAVEPARFSDRASTLRWFERELPNLLGSTAAAAARGWDEVAWRLGWALDSFLALRGYFGARERTLTICVEATRRLGDEEAEYAAWNNLGNLHEDLIDFDRASECYQRALDMVHRLGRTLDEAVISGNVGAMWLRVKEWAKAADRLEECLRLHEELDEPDLRAVILHNLASARRGLGRLDDAIELNLRAYQRFVEVADVERMALSLQGRVQIQLDQGRAAEAVVAGEESVVLQRVLSNRLGEAASLRTVGLAHRALGDLATAEARWTMALGIYADLGSPQAAGVRDLLAGLPPGG